MYVRIDELIFPEPVVAGMNFLVLGALAHFYRSCNEDTTPIIVEYSEVYDGAYAIKDGRHRAVASMIAGRKTVLAVLHEP